MSTAKFDTLSNVAGTQSVPVATVAQGSAKAWVNFNGTGTVAIRAAFNVSSITDNGTGDYTVNFTSAFPDASYAPAFSGTGRSVALTQPENVLIGIYGTFATGPVLKTTTQIRIAVGIVGSLQDNADVNASFFR